MDNLARALDDLQSSDEARAEAAVNTLAELGPAALPAVRPLLESASADTRWWAIRAAAGIGDRSVGTLLCAALVDPAPEVRQAAALGLREHPAVEAAPKLIGRLADSDDLVRRLASDALAALGGPAVATLRKALAEPPPAGAYAARALALMRDPAAIPALFAALDHDSHLARYWAERGLDDLGVGMVFFEP